ncbi:YdeI/OmpD-associated family protein [candidate division KSB1 bacterium]|nr:YdeI/OmpD-associated family protein [candidate division KSB1 bacterium]
MQQQYFQTSDEWRNWLQENHAKENKIWLLFYKKETGKPSIDYESAVEEALCFGWIDSIIKKIDDQKYARKFTPRKDDSNWSELNKKRVKKLIASNRMTEVGLAKINIAKKNGQWDKPDRPNIPVELPPDFQHALEQNPKANENFQKLALTYQKHYIGWISIAKRQETKEKRIKESIALLERGEKLGLK